MRKSWRSKRRDKIRARCAAAGRKSQRVQAARRMEARQNVWELVRVIDIRRADGSVAATWRVFATHDPAAPLSVDFGDELHRYMSPRRLAPLIARKMFAATASSEVVR